MVEIRPLEGESAASFVKALAGVLVDCVEGGASVSFMAPFSLAEAETFFREVVESVRRGERILLAAFLDGRLVGTVQVITSQPPNQPHRADVAKLLVNTAVRRRGIAQQLIETAERVARQAGKTLLVLDTVTGGAAERLYLRLGWNRVGVIPNYAMFPDGRFCDTTLFWKNLS